MRENKSEILQGTLDLLVLKTLEATGTSMDMASLAAPSS